MPTERNYLIAALQEGSAGILPLLRAVKESSDVFPPLKSAVSVALIIGNMVMVCSDLISVFVLG